MVSQSCTEDQKNVFAYVSSQTEECQTQELHQCIQVKPMQVKHFLKEWYSPSPSASGIQLVCRAPEDVLWLNKAPFLLFFQLEATVDLLHGAWELTSSEGTPAPLINWWGSCQRVLPRLSCSPSALPGPWPRAAPQPCASPYKILLLTKLMVSHRHTALS